MKKRELFTMSRIMGELKNAKTSVKFAYGLSKNRKMVDIELDAIKEIAEPTAEVKGYEEARVNICERFAEKDEAARPKIVEGNYVIEEKGRKTFEKQLAKLKDDHKTVLDEHAEKMKGVELILDEEVDTQWYKIKMDLFPEGLKQYQYDVLMEFADMEDENF